MNANLVNILTWTNPLKSAGYLVGLNILLRFLYYQRPIGAVAIIVLVSFLRNLWKHRIRPEVLVDPPDCEEWVNLSAYDLEKSAVDFGKSIFTSWVSLRSEHYLMWVILTSVFWVTLAKVSCLVSFPTMLLVLSNGVFIAFPLLKNLRLDVSRLQEEDNPAVLDTPTSSASRNASPPVTESPKGRLHALQDLSASISSSVIRTIEPFLSGAGLGTTPEEEISLPAEIPAALAPDSSRERSRTPPEPESLTPYGVTIPSHEDSSEDEFLFDPKHFESSSSSTSNSFELLQF